MLTLLFNKVTNIYSKYPVNKGSASEFRNIFWPVLPQEKSCDFFTGIRLYILLFKTKRKRNEKKCLNLQNGFFYQMETLTVVGQ